MFKALKIKEENRKSIRRVLFITEMDLERPYGASVNDRKTINCMRKFGKLKCFYLKRMQKQNPLRKYFSVLKVFSWIIKKRPHVIFLRSIYFAAVLGILKHVFKTKLVYLALSVPFKSIEAKLYEGTPAQLSKISQNVIKVIEPLILLKTSDMIIVSNRSTKLELVNYGVKSRNTRIIPFYIERTFFDIPLKKETGDYADYFTIGYIGQFTPLHDLKYLIEVAKELVDKIKNLRLILVGDGPLFNEIKDTVKKNNLQSHVTLTGRVPHVSIPEIISNFDIFIVPLIKNFISSALPIKVLEGAASARALIITRVGGIDKILRDKESCLFVNPENHNEISKAILTLYKSPVLREKLGSAAREKVRKYSAENVCIKYLHILKSLGIREENYY